MKETVWFHTYQRVLDVVLPRVALHGEAIQQAVDAANAAVALVPSFEEKPAKTTQPKAK